MARPLWIEYAGAFYHVTPVETVRCRITKAFSRTQRKLKDKKESNREVEELESTFKA